MTTKRNNSNHATDRVLGSTAVLFAVVLGLLCLRTPEPIVEAGMVVSADSYTVMTAAAQTGGQTVSDEDALYIMDNHHGVLLIYRTRNQAGTDRIELVDGGFISDLFATVRK